MQGSEDVIQVYVTMFFFESLVFVGDGARTSGQRLSSPDRVREIEGVAFSLHTVAFIPHEPGFHLCTFIEFRFSLPQTPWSGACLTKEKHPSWRQRDASVW